MAEASMSAAEPELGNEVWEAGAEAPRLEEALVVSLDGFAGPLDVLLALARTQKVDLAKISVLALAEQYLGFIAQARKLRLELAADYLVMAAWLAYLKSKLLLPKETTETTSRRARSWRHGSPSA
jgi:segregation and condensation protein A